MLLYKYLKTISTDIEKLLTDACLVERISVSDLSSSFTLWNVKTTRSVFGVQFVTHVTQTVGASWVVDTSLVTASVAI